MRDAIGGTFMLRILIIFIVLYIVFMCFAVSYAKTFRLKNKVIDILEQQGYDYSSVEEINEYLDSNAYDFPGTNHSQVSNHCDNVSGNVSKYLTSKGACIVPKDSGNNRYYQVYLYIVYYFPFFHWEVVMPVGGETEVIPEEEVILE